MLKMAQLGRLLSFSNFFLFQLKKDLGQKIGFRLEEESRYLIFAIYEQEILDGQ